MSWTTPSSAIPQVDDRRGVTSQGEETNSFFWKAPYADLETAIGSLRKGDLITTGWRASSWTLMRRPGNWGLLEIVCSPDDMTGGQSTDPSQVPLKETWSLKSVRNDISILGYCDPACPELREAIEMWQKETESDLVKEYKFRDKNGEEVELSSMGDQLINIAKKINKGVESVMRFYPLLTKRTLFSQPPATVLQNLAHIDVPSAGTGDKVHKPGNLANVISLHQWLKCQDDCDQQSDGNWVRTEAWMGIPFAAVHGNQPWDPNFYGEVGDDDTGRWVIPYARTGTASED